MVVLPITTNTVLVRYRTGLTRPLNSLGREIANFEMHENSTVIANLYVPAILHLHIRNFVFSAYLKLDLFSANSLNDLPKSLLWYLTSSSHLLRLLCFILLVSFRSNIIPLRSILCSFQSNRYIRAVQSEYLFLLFGQFHGFRSAFRDERSLIPSIFTHYLPREFVNPSYRCFRVFF